LSGMLLVVYFAAVALLQMFFQSFTGSRQSEIVLVSSTLVTASLFSPLRQRIQNVIDRRFYRSKYDAARALEAFGITVRDEVDLNRISGSLVRVIKETIQPASISLWLNTPARPVVDEQVEERSFHIEQKLGVSWDELRNHNPKGE